MAQAIEIIASARILYGFAVMQVASSANRLTAMIFDETNTELLGLKTVEVIGRSMPPVKSNTLSVPGRPGTYFFGSSLDERVLEVKTYLKAESKTAYDTAAATLKALLNPVKGEKKIVFNDVLNRYYYGRLADWQEGYQDSKFSEQTLIFACSDPYIYGPEVYVRTEAVAVIENQGTQDTAVTATITGPASFPTVTVKEQYFRYEGSLGPSDELIIDTHLDQYTALLNGVNVIDKMTGVFAQLAVGASDVSISSGVLELRFSPRWL